jgi:hypothetical protein
MGAKLLHAGHTPEEKQAYVSLLFNVFYNFLTNRSLKNQSTLGRG